MAGASPRTQVLSLYRQMLKSAFSVKWTSDEDALYVLTETRRLFRVNQSLTDPARILRKIREAEQRYALAVHYRIPYPRMFHKAQGSAQGWTGVAYASYMDSLYEEGATNPSVGIIEEGSSNTVVAGAYAAAGTDAVKKEETEHVFDDRDRLT